MKVIFKKKVMDLKKNDYFPIGEEVYLNDARFQKIRESVLKFGKEEEYFEIIKAITTDAKCSDINSMVE